jgi:hypothetical protein
MLHMLHRFIPLVSPQGLPVSTRECHLPAHRSLPRPEGAESIGNARSAMRTMGGPRYQYPSTPRSYKKGRLTALKVAKERPVDRHYATPAVHESAHEL